MTVAGVGLREGLKASWKEGCLTGCPSSRRGGGEAPKELSFLFLSFFLKKVWVFFLLSFLVFFCLSWVEGGREEN